jgi:protocatechuate 3,4-dioxygenase beta subunit
MADAYGSGPYGETRGGSTPLVSTLRRDLLSQSLPAIKPVPYPSRAAPHIHFMIKVKGREPWTTQLYIKGHPGNARDGVYRGIGDASEQDAVTVDFKPVKDSRIGELAAKFDILLGFTPKVS